MNQNLKNWMQSHFADIVISLLAAAAAAILLINEPSVHPTSKMPNEKCKEERGIAASSQSAKVVEVEDSKGVDIIIPGSFDSDGISRSTARLKLAENATLPPGTHLTTSTTGLARQTDGVSLPEEQVASTARVGPSGRTVFLAVCVAPRYGEVSAFGSYAGAAGLDDSRVLGGNVPIVIHVKYPYMNRVGLAALLSACAGLIWARVVRRGDAGLQADSNHSQWVLLVVSVAAGIACVFSVDKLVWDPKEWQGTSSEYWDLVVAASGAVIAAVPTLQSLLSHVTKANSETSH
ncbi:hypothetical protein [Streptomyces sp. NPDC050416]|uniref:hypothetical protein n=1 Tax=Streptomyces sp. NPDC050416 TaxID=3365611 RepID=UPI0037A5627B